MLHWKKQWLLGVLAGCAIVLIWSGWIIASRSTLQHSLNPVDLTWLRFVCAAVVVLPLSLRHDWRALPLGRALVIALGCGFPYTLLSYYGLTILPSANASVIVNGTLPIFAAMLAYFVLRQAWTVSTLALAGIMLVANALAMSSPDLVSLAALRALLVLLLAAAVLSVYMTAVKAWAVSLKEIVVWVPTINAVLFTPVWLMSESGIAACPPGELLFQLLYQGVLVSVVALFLFSYAVKVLGSVTTSMFMAFVPAATAILALLLLGERPGAAQWCGIALCSAGLLLSGRASMKGHAVASRGARS